LADWPWSAGRVSRPPAASLMRGIPRLADRTIICRVDVQGGLCALTPPPLNTRQPKAALPMYSVLYYYTAADWQGVGVAVYWLPYTIVHGYNNDQYGLQESVESLTTVRLVGVPRCRSTSLIRLRLFVSENYKENSDSTI